MFFSAADLAELQANFFPNLQTPVELVLFQLPDSEKDCSHCLCDETEAMLKELVAYSPQLTLTKEAFSPDNKVLAHYGIVRAPGIAFRSAGREYNFWQYGIPSGYLLHGFLETLIDLSSGRTELSPATRSALREVTSPINVQLFSTPQCPMCSISGHLLAQFALANPLIHASFINAQEFPELADSYGIRRVPQLLINELKVPTSTETSEPALLAQLLTVQQKVTVPV